MGSIISLTHTHLLSLYHHLLHTLARTAISLFLARISTRSLHYNPANCSVTPNASSLLGFSTPVESQGEGGLPVQQEFLN